MKLKNHNGFYDIFKSFISLALIIIFLFSALPSFASDYGDFTYELEQGSAVITGYTGKGGDINIPLSIGGRAVTKIGDSAFEGNKNITAVSLSSNGLANIKTIGKNAFKNCSSLESVLIPSSVNLISDFAFSGCTGLSEITISSSSTEIGICSFENCDSLLSVYIPSSSVGYGAFRNCENLSEVDLAESVLSVGEKAFYNTLYYKNLTSSAKYIGSVLYEYSGNASSFEISDGTLSIADCAFSGSSVSKVIIPDSVKSIGINAFYGCDNLESVFIPSSTDYIGENAFGFNKSGKKQNFKVYCYSGSAAEKYCKNNNIDFEIIDSHEHQFSDWETVRSNSCVTDGLKERICEKCNYKETYTIPASGHKFGDGVVLTEPSCTADGVTRYTCTICGYKEDKITKASGHKFGAWKTISEATCSSEGERKRVCEICGETETEKIEKLPHTWITDADTDSDGYRVGISPTCENPGYKIRVCSVCDFTESVLIPALGHEVKNWTVTKKATEISEGAETGICERCGKTVTRATDKIGEILPSDVNSITVKDETSGIEMTDFTSPGGTAAMKVPAGTTIEDALFSLNYPGHIIPTDKNDNIITSVDYGKNVYTGMYFNLTENPEDFSTAPNVISNVIAVVIGDLDSDGKVTALDARICLRASARLESLSRICILASDADGDENLTASDARRILRTSARLDGGIIKRGGEKNTEEESSESYSEKSEDEEISEIVSKEEISVLS